MSELLERVPFEVAIKAPKLLKPRWDGMSKPQQVVLKAFYGLPLSDEELVYWSIFQGGATYDALGYVKSVKLVPYKAKEYDFLNLYVGRRSGKTDKIISTGVAYEITLGGHRKHVPEGQQMRVPFIAQTAGDALKNMNFIRLALRESPLLSKLLPDVKDEVASEIRLLDAKREPYLIVESQPANKAVGRGHGIPVWVGDETAFWYTDPNAANPDFEVLRAISFAQAQFPDAKTFIGTTPWSEQGVAFKNWKAGTEGRNLQCDACKAEKAFICEHSLEAREEYEGVLVIHASTAAMENPRITRKRLVQIKKRDPEAFPRESLALTLKSVGSWLSEVKVDLAVKTGVAFRPKEQGQIYVAAMDPAFRKDSFAFTILHHDMKKGLVQDYIQYWVPEQGNPLKPGDILDQIKVVLDQYGIGEVYSDQYQLESLQQLALDRNFVINGFDFTGKSKGQACGSFKFVLDQERLSLLDDEVQTDQLKKLQRRVLQTGNVQIAAPVGQHDDLAMVLILASRILVWLIADAPQSSEKPKDIEHDHVAIGKAQIERRRQEALAAMDDD